jgi:hypothetical protein
MPQTPKTFQADTDFTDGWSLGGSMAGNIWGASVDVGGGGAFDFTYGPINGIVK